ncbi:benzoate 4-monooxygenase [Fusarium subglutinans]|uniref:Benzoate 4-monooxygenase n=1 Tax=Gibberella subglutinans TaxID=42677 RepID=A0A8H5L6T9_GIBSU|nr:benzoate 4-monooxygenase [Fusarium subglutinans]KAF5586377.1 benzoate 4-monooxygenase [Fusarium subglutinans]
MALTELLISPWAPLALAVALVAWYILPWISNSNLRGIPAPFPAQFTNLWLLSTCRRGKRYEIVDQVHKKLGVLVRIAPNHVSVADADAINTIYGHGNGFLKAAEHSRKRKIVSHTFAPKSVLEFEPYIRQNLDIFINQWDRIASNKDADGYGSVDCLNWFNFLAFDIIADLAFGKPFGMLSTGADIAEVKASPTSPTIYAPAVEIMNRRGEVSATLGCLPQLKPYAKYLPDPFFSQGLQAVENLAGIAIARVSERLERGGDSTRKDLLARLMQGRDEKGEPLGRDELTAEALTQLIAGSDTTSNSSCALLYHIVRTPGVMQRLYEEICAVVPEDVAIPDYESVKHLPYLGHCINETLRIHSPSGIGLPREIPPNHKGVTLHGRYFGPGTVLSVPTYTIHHSTEIWGPDADEFKPERWENLTDKQKNAFIPFSYGPRSCVGRNLAEMQMRLIAATWIKRYDVRLRQDIMETREGFLRKPMGLDVGLARR